MPSLSQAPVGTVCDCPVAEAEVEAARDRAGDVGETEAAAGGDTQHSHEPPAASSDEVPRSDPTGPEADRSASTLRQSETLGPFDLTRLSRWPGAAIWHSGALICGPFRLTYRTCDGVIRRSRYREAACTAP